MPLLSSSKLVRWLAVAGLVLLVLALVYPASYVFFAAKARQLDKKEGLLSEGPCDHLQIDLHLDMRFVGLDESEKLTAHIRNSGKQPCKARIRILAVKIEVDPHVERTVDLPPDRDVELFWIVSPK